MTLTDKELQLIKDMLNQVTAQGVESMKTVVELYEKVEVEITERGATNE